MSRVPLPLAQLALSAMNHVLQQQPAARERMRSHVSRIVRIVVASPLGQMHSDAPGRGVWVPTSRSKAT
jgi:hypothetical protein